MKEIPPERLENEFAVDVLIIDMIVEDQGRVSALVFVTLLSDFEPDIGAVLYSKRHRDSWVIVDFILPGFEAHEKGVRFYALDPLKATISDVRPIEEGEIFCLQSELG